MAVKILEIPREQQMISIKNEFTHSLIISNTDNQTMTSDIALKFWKILINYSFGMYICTIKFGLS